MKQIINTKEAPAPVGPYSQAVMQGDTLFVSGQIPLDPHTGQMAQGGLEAETRQVMENLRAILQTASMTFSDVVKCSIFLLDMDHFAAVNSIYAEYFGDQPPARETVAVAGLPKGAQVEISCIAKF